MFCTNCGSQVSAGANQCPECGKPVSNEAGKPITNASKSGDASATSSSTGGSGLAPEPGQLAGRLLGGRYQLGELIGSGGMGEIYRARRTHIGDAVAVKVLRSDVVGNEKTRQRFYREARAAAMLHHPNVVVIHDFGEDDGGAVGQIAYIVMELLNGRSLRQVLSDEGALDPLRAYSIVRQACAALEAGHRSGVIHRDIKPDNIILLSHDEDSDHVKLLDFGIAKLRDKALDTLSVENNLTNIGTVIGTPNYMSPEQCQGEEADARSDIYSLGVVMYEILTGVMPFIAKTSTAVAIKHVTEAPRPLRELQPTLPAEVEAVVLNALEKTPEARPQSMLELARAFAAALKQADATSLLGRTGQPGTKAIHIDTPRTDEMQGTPRTLTTPKPEATGDEFKTVISDEEEQQPLPVKVNEDAPRLTAVLAPAADNSFKTVVTESAVDTQDKFKTDVSAEPVATSFDTVLTDEPLVAQPRDAYATMIPEPPEPVRDAYATMIPVAPEPKVNAAPNRTEIMQPPAETKAQIFEGTELLSTPTPTISPVAKAEAESKSGKGSAKPDKKEKRKDRQQGKAVASAAVTVVEIPQAPVTASVQTGQKSGSQRVLLMGIAAVALAAALAAWAFLTDGNKPPVVDKPTTQASPAATNTPIANAPVVPAGMVYIPGGEFKVGREDGEENERPAHSIIVAPFFIGQTEVTNEQYAKFIEATGYFLPPSWQGKRYPVGADKLPVTDVTWADANEYAKWAQKRLPTEEEWEIAARGTDGRVYPWGSIWEDDLANVAKDEANKRQLAPVGTYLRGQSFYGAFDMVGNAWEWTASDYKEYAGGKPIQTPEGYQNLKVIRGCSYGCQAKLATATYRRGWPATRQDMPEGAPLDYNQTGFRCAQDAPQK